MVENTFAGIVQPSSPFDGFASTSLSAEGIAVEAQPYCIKLGLRGSPDDAAFVKAVEAFCGAPLPLVPNTVHRNPESALYWLGPDEWQWRLASGHPESAEAVVGRFRKALNGVASSIVDLSDYYAVMRLEGNRVFDVLAKGTPLDVRRQLADPAKCAQTRFGQASLLLSRLDTGDELGVDVQVRWSFVEYVWLFLSASIAEYVPEQAS